MTRHTVPASIGSARVKPSGSAQALTLTRHRPNPKSWVGAGLGVALQKNEQILLFFPRPAELRAVAGFRVTPCYHIGRESSSCYRFSSADCIGWVQGLRPRACRSEAAARWGNAQAVTGSGSARSVGPEDELELRPQFVSMFRASRRS
jgi:hypothetical protein